MIRQQAPPAAGLVLALAGGVGGAKLALGLARILPPDRLVIVVNTGDDDRFHGLHIAPDLDTMTYTLSGLYNPETGWGIAGDTFETLAMLNRLGADTWFNLGDRDFAMHIHRTELLRRGLSLSEVTARLTARLGIAHAIVPMSDQPVRTMLATDAGELAMQEYFVRHRAAPPVRAIRYDGAERALPAPAFAAALQSAETIVICPSNPYLSVAPILAVPRRAGRHRQPSRPPHRPLAPSSGAMPCAGRPARLWRNWAPRSPPPASPAPTPASAIPW